MLTNKGPIEAREVVIATNGYTGDVTPTLKRRLVPVASHIIATEELPEDLVKSLIPKGRVVSDTKRVLCYYRRSPDDKRVIFGGRARFTQVTPEVSAPVLHGYMLERWPQLKGTKVTHAWTGNVAFAFDFLPHMGQEQGMHYLMACNGSGVAMMSYLGYQTARKIAGGSNAPINAFDGQDFPTVPFYSGNPWFLPDGRRLVSHPRLVGSSDGLAQPGSGHGEGRHALGLARREGQRLPETRFLQQRPQNLAVAVRQIGEHLLQPQPATRHVGTGEAGDAHALDLVARRLLVAGDGVAHGDHHRQQATSGEFHQGVHSLVGRGARPRTVVAREIVDVVRPLEQPHGPLAQDPDGVGSMTNCESMP